MKPGSEPVADALSELIRLCAIRGSLDVRCRMAGPYVVEHAPSPAGEAAFHMVLAGACRVTIDGGQATCGAGDLVVLPKGAAHQIYCLSAQQRAWISRQPGLSVAETPGPPELDLICGRFNYQPTAGALLFDSLPPLLFVPRMQMPEGFAELIRTDAAYRPPGATELVTALTSVLFIMVMRRHMSSSPLDRGMLALMVDRGLAVGLVEMMRDPAAPWTIERLACLANMSRATFLRRFTAAAGRGPAELLLDVRIHLAMRLLRDSGRAIPDIAAAVGYRSVVAFGRAFQRRTGLTPVQARRPEVVV